MQRLAALALMALPALAATQPAVPWTRGATCYEVFVRSFYDSNGDGIGDLQGLIEKLDYINDGNAKSTRSLGAKCIWLMPIAESPSYHGYDVTDYYRVEPDYGSNEDFKRLVAAAHKRGIKVLVDMVLNHASSQHPFFQQALRDTTSPYRAWFRWSPTKPAELNPWGQSNWHKSPLRDEWYYGFFWGGMPDLNYTHPPVVAEAKKVARFWLKEMGVDGFRLDAVPYLIEEPGAIHHSPATHAVLRDYQSYLRSVKRDVFTVGEVTDTGNGILESYYPDQLDSYFAFALADKIIEGVRKGDARGLLEPVLRLQRIVPRDRLAPFLRNHDQTRTRTELGGDVAKSRVAALLMLTMPGLPFVYYGEEIGMIGNKPDERLRTPMQWRNVTGGGFTIAKPWERLQDDSSTTTVESQDKDSTSLLNLHRRLIHLRSATPALARGVLIPLTTSNDAVTAYLRREGDHVVLVVANLSSAALDGITVSSGERALPAGSFVLRDLLGGTDAARVRIARDGRVSGLIPLQTLAPMQGYLFELRTSTR
ncbi:MAG: alpha-amylase family glycosyl hydrolase [Gemmatimonadota bacterium]